MKHFFVAVLLAAPFLNAHADLKCVTANGKTFVGTKTSSDDLYTYFTFKVGSSIYHTKSIDGSFMNSDQSFKLLFDLYTGLGTAKIDHALTVVDCAFSE
jgi:hypothetical protein